MDLRRLILALALLFLATSALLAVKWTGVTPVPASEPSISTPDRVVTVAAVARDTVRHTIKAVGTLLANESVMIRPEIAGRIRQIHFQEGEPVDKGRLLVELDDSELQAELAQAAAQLTLSRQTYERLKRIDGGGRQYVSKQQVDDVAGALHVSEATHALYATRLAKTRIRAPFAGVTGIRRVSPGEFVAIGRDLVNLEDLDRLKIDFKVPETALHHLARGQPIELTTDASPGHVFHGTVYAIDPQVDLNTRSVQLRALIPNAQQRLRPGMFAQVVLTVGQDEQALMIPEEAVMPRQNSSYVFLVEQGIARLREVRLGERIRGFVQVVEGLTHADSVVRVGHHKLRDGDSIHSVPTSPDP
ncbi:MAG: efflux RND transporter periplasmic adaptor subunit [Nitrospiraceae bacterium]